MISVNASMGCCGMRELTGVSNLTASQIKDLLTKFEVISGDSYTRKLTLDPALYVFTDRTAGPTHNPGRPTQYGMMGNKLAEKIKKFEIGKLVETEPYVNPSSGNFIKGWLWTLTAEDISKAKKRFKEEEANKKKDEKQKPKPANPVRRRAVGTL